MANKKMVVVLGATGNQGGSVVNALLDDFESRQKFSLRAVTRNPDSEKGRALKQRGVECVQGDLNSQQQLDDAFRNAYAVFGVTDFWSHGDSQIEEQQGMNIANAAKVELVGPTGLRKALTEYQKAGVQHLVWSSARNVTEMTNGKLVGMHHWQSKANVEQNIRNLGIPATFFLAGFFMQTLSTAFFRQDKASNTWTLQMPFAANTPMPLIDAATDTGKYVKSILHQREKMLGKRILAAADYYTAQEVVDVFVEAKPEAGKGASYKEVSPAIFRAYLRDDLGFGEGAQDELLENMQLLSEFGYFGGADLAESNSILTDKLTSWKDFVANAPELAHLK